MKNTINLVIISIWMAIATISCSKKEELVDKIPVKVDSYYPNSGKAGTLVTIEGQGFSGANTEFSATVAGGQQRSLALLQHRLFYVCQKVTKVAELS
ncbi:Uncharacterised protein [Sphingobacterium multivorum]|uniref:IPT/TIG domain-containing protein n=1 Tax=Sphingobacterium multivorum TaxID=28454 RepID=A0A2X2IWX0_SPHMU|nr:IPT/TIG domain-containing protein [Sphingobacterium multivorum]SPZ83756.1 Uncharacterised protein [Sphingobacterium multivorum]